VGPTGTLAAVGVIHEAGGADTYVSHAVGRAEAHAHDAESAPAEPRTAKATATLGAVGTRGLGFADIGSAAFFLDAGASDDVYTLLAEGQTEAVATAASPDTRLSTGEGPGLVSSHSLASSPILGAFSEFQDAGGNDTYNVTSRSIGSSQVDVDNTTSTMGSALESGIAVFVDAGGTDAVTLVPPEPVCGGEPRGTGRYWQDCEGVAFGANV
jgi:hypothetical protein